eukprot:15459670-Alexandrium_andersonii.AAC.1
MARAPARCQASRSRNLWRARACSHRRRWLLTRKQGGRAGGCLATPSPPPTPDTAAPAAGRTTAR